MSRFGKALFSGSRFIFWSLAPFLILFAIATTLTTVDWNITSAILVIVMDMVALLLTVGLYNTTRFWWALRGVTTIVFLAYVAYLLDDLIHLSNTITLAGIVNGDRPWRSIGAFLSIGIPCLVYSIVGRFSWRQESGGSLKKSRTTTSPGEHESSLQTGYRKSRDQFAVLFRVVIRNPYKEQSGRRRSMCGDIEPTLGSGSGIQKAGEFSLA